MDNWLSAEPLLKARLEDQVPELKGQVNGAPDLQTVQERNRKAASCDIVYTGYRVVEERAAGKLARIRQLWYVIPVIRNVRQAQDGAPNRAAAGPIIAKVNAALMGHRLSKEHGNLLPATPPHALYHAGSGYYPLAYEIPIAIKGGP